MAELHTARTDLLAAQIRQRYHDLYGGDHLTVWSPGRVNLIGEHTDYNEGFVLPAAVDKGIRMALHRRADDHIRLYAAGPGEHYEIRLADLHPVQQPHWANYILGVVHGLRERGYAVGGFNAVFDGDVPMGAGMSSSAALECAAVFALNEAYGLGIERLEMVQIAQQAEHTYAGVLCGIMDQFASMFGRADQLVQLDCRSLEYQYIPAHMEGYRMVLLNTNVAHSLAASAYNERRAQCMEGVRLLRGRFPEVRSLRDATADMLDAVVRPADETVWRRCRYVVDENTRLLRACDALQGGDLSTLGRLMFETHNGLSREYEVSCAELDFLVSAVKGREEVLGARMMGGGFGGCTINLVRADAIEPLVAAVGASYQESMGLELTPYIVQTDHGTSLLS